MCWLEGGVRPSSSVSVKRVYVSSWGFLILFGASIWTIAAHAQKPTMPVIGFINAASAQGYALPLSAFLKGLGDTGYVEGRNDCQRCGRSNTSSGDHDCRDHHSSGARGKVSHRDHSNRVRNGRGSDPARARPQPWTPRRQYHGRDPTRRGHSAKATAIAARAGAQRRV